MSFDFSGYGKIYRAKNRKKAKERRRKMHGGDSKTSADVNKGYKAFLAKRGLKARTPQQWKERGFPNQFGHDTEHDCDGFM